ncbi:zinc-binding dehydrogenase [Candidatus Hodarchaeum mangrovi]
MKAVLIHQFGGVENLIFDEFPTPDISDDQVLVKVKAVALNHLDLFVRAGIPNLKLELPHILGSDISGTIEMIGSRVKHLSEGQKVIIDPSLSCGVCEFCYQGEISLCDKYKIIGEHTRGGYAEYIVVPSENVIKIPDNAIIDVKEAAAVPLTFMTAYRMLMTRAKLKLGEDVLITGIGGGVALAALQIAKLVGSRTFVTSSSNDKLQKAKKYGADFIINYKEQPDYQKEIWKLTGKRGVDIVVDSAGQETWDKNMRCLRKGGRLVTCGATTGYNTSMNLNLLFWKQFDLLGSTMGTRNELREVLKFVWDGRLKPIIDSFLPLSDARKAHKKLEDGTQFGKIVLES